MQSLAKCGAQQSLRIATGNNERICSRSNQRNLTEKVVNKIPSGHSVMSSFANCLLFADVDLG